MGAGYTRAFGVLPCRLFTVLWDACAPLRTRLLQLLFPRVGHDTNPRLSQPANHLAKFDQFLIGHEAQTFAQLLQFGLRWIQKQWTSPVSPAEVGTAFYCGRCTNRCTTSFRPCPISPTVADYCRRIRLIPLSPSSELPTVTAEAKKIGPLTAYRAVAYAPLKPHAVPRRVVLRKNSI